MWSVSMPPSRPQHGSRATEGVLILSDMAVLLSHRTKAARIGLGKIDEAVDETVIEWQKKRSRVIEAEEMVMMSFAAPLKGHMEGNEGGMG